MARSRSNRSLLRRFAALNGRRRALLLEAAWWLFVARLALAVFPFRTLAARLGAFTTARGKPARCSVSPEQSQWASDVGWAVTRVARYLPSKATCLPQAIAAKRMLDRRGIASVLHFGAARGAEPQRPLQAHAWLEAAGVEVTGYPVSPRFTEVACFV